MLYIKVVTAILFDEDSNAYLDARRLSHLKRMHELIEPLNKSDLVQALHAEYDRFRLEFELHLNRCYCCQARNINKGDTE